MIDKEIEKEIRSCVEHKFSPYSVSKELVESIINNILKQKDLELKIKSKPSQWMVYANIVGEFCRNLDLNLRFKPKILKETVERLILEADIEDIYVPELLEDKFIGYCFDEYDVCEDYEKCSELKKYKKFVDYRRFMFDSDWYRYCYVCYNDYAKAVSLDCVSLYALACLAWYELTQRPVEEIMKILGLHHDEYMRCLALSENCLEAKRMLLENFLYKTKISLRDFKVTTSGGIHIIYHYKIWKDILKSNHRVNKIVIDDYLHNFSYKKSEFGEG